jgi:hypothetical protein
VRGKALRRIGGHQAPFASGACGVIIGARQRQAKLGRLMQGVHS